MKCNNYINFKCPYIKEIDCKSYQYRFIQEFNFFDLSGTFLYQRNFIRFDNKLRRISKKMINSPQSKNYFQRIICIISDIKWNYGYVLYFFPYIEHTSVFSFFHIYEYFKDKKNEYYETSLITYNFTSSADLVHDTLYIPSTELATVKEIIEKIVGSVRLIVNLS